MQFLEVTTEDVEIRAAEILSGLSDPNTDPISDIVFRQARLELYLNRILDLLRRTSRIEFNMGLAPQYTTEFNMTEFRRMFLDS